MPRGGDKLFELHGIPEDGATFVIARDGVPRYVWRGFGMCRKRLWQSANDRECLHDRLTARHAGGIPAGRVSAAAGGDDRHAQPMLWLDRNQEFSSMRGKGPDVTRFHFNVYDGAQHHDIEGEELPDIRAARKYAVRYFGEMLQGDLGRFWDGAEWKMDVTDETGLSLFSLHFIAIDAPALDNLQVKISV